MSAKNETDHTRGANEVDENARRQAQASADADELRQRREQAARDAANAAADDARVRAESASQLAERAERAAEDDGTEVIDMDKSIGVRITGGGTRHYGPGKGIRVPHDVAEAYRHAPTFATSGDRVSDRAVRRMLEREHGVKEINSQDDTAKLAARAASGEDVGGANDDGESVDSRESGAQTSRRAARETGNRRKAPPTEAELDNFDAEEITRRYETGVRAGKVKPIEEGKGSGADGNIVKADKVAALAEAYAAEAAASEGEK